MRKFFFLLFIFIASDAYCQQSIDVLRSKISNAPTDSIKIENMALLAEVYLQRQDAASISEAKKIMQDALAVSNNINNTYSISLSYIILNKVATAEGEKKDAKKSLSSAEKYCKKIGTTPDRLMQMRALKMAYQRSEEANARNRQEIERARQESELNKLKYEQELMVTIPHRAPHEKFPSAHHQLYVRGDR